MQMFKKSVSILLTVIITFSVFTVLPAVEVNAANGISYVERSWNSGTKKVDQQTKNRSSYTDFGSVSGGNLSAGWYAVTQDKTIEDRLCVSSGTVNIILCDGSTLTLEEGIRVPEGTVLNIYGQQNDSGSLSAQSEDYESAIGSNDEDDDDENGAGTINIHGGKVTAESGDDSAGIGGGNEAHGGTVTIYGGTVTATGGTDAAGIGTGDEYEGNTPGSVTIYGGTVTAKAGELGAGIGGGDDVGNVTVSILGGEVTATAEYKAAGIGGGEDKGSGTITISNAKVTATGGYDGGAGIGGGSKGSNGNITITDSEVSSKSFTHKDTLGGLGAGIGSGRGVDQSGTIRITNSTVTAQGGVGAMGSNAGGAGIGGGDDGNGGDIYITGSYVIAVSGAGAGIGGGDSGNNKYTEISSSTVYAASTKRGAGIGGGDDGDGGTVKIINGSNVTATGSGSYFIPNLVRPNPSASPGEGTGYFLSALVLASDYYGAGIGGGDCGNGADVSIFNSTVTAVVREDRGAQAIGWGHSGFFSGGFSKSTGSITYSSNMKVSYGTAVEENGEYTFTPTQTVASSKRVEAMRSEKIVQIAPCDHSGETHWEYYSEANHCKRCNLCGCIAGYYEQHNWNSQQVCTVCGGSAILYNYKFISRNASGEQTQTLSLPYNSTFAAPECTAVPDGYEFTSWSFSDGTFAEPGDEVRIKGRDMEIRAVYMPVIETCYADPLGNEHTVNARQIQYTGGKLYLSDGWYVINNDINFGEGNIIYNGNINLIIADGVSVTFTQYPVEPYFDERSAIGIRDLENELTRFSIYGQKNQSGIIEVGVRCPYFYNLSLYGATLSFTGDGSIGYGRLSVMNFLDVYGGKLVGEIVDSKKLTINGGQVDLGLNIANFNTQLGWTNLTDSILIREMESGAVTVKNNQRMTDGTNIYSGTLDTSQVNAINGKTLYPYDHQYSEPEWVWEDEYTSAKAVFRCSECDDVQEVKAQVTYEDSGKFRTSHASCTFNKKDYSVTVTNQILYGINVAQCENGTVSAEKALAKKGENIGLTVTPGNNCALKELYYTVAGGQKTVITGNSFIMPEKDVTVTAVFAKRVSRVEPEIDSNGDYKPGVIEHYTAEGKYYAVNADGTVGSELESVELSYFDFKELSDGTWQIEYYTGSADTITSLEIPLTYQGKKVTVLGNDSNKPLMKNTDAKSQFTLYLSKNITEIKPYAFFAMWVTDVSGDTSSLSKIGDYAFSWANSPGDYNINVELDYPGKITAGREIFNNMNVILNLKHATTFSTYAFNAQHVTYGFTDAHPYAEPVWNWSNDNTSASAQFTCSDSRCNDQKTLDAVITSVTEEGKITYTATVESGGKTYTDTKTVYNDGIGERLAGHTLLLNGSIGVNFYMELDDSVTAHKDTAYMQFTIPSGSKSVTERILVKDAEVKVLNGKTYYVFRCSIAAKEMTSRIKAQIIDGEKFGREYTYSVKEYADYLLAHPEVAEYANAAQLVKAMLNYGAGAQLYFDKTEYGLANSGLSDNDKITPDVTAAMIGKSSYENNLRDGISFEGATLSLKSQTTLSFYFLSDTDNLTFTCSGNKTVETTRTSTGYVVRVRNISAGELQNDFTVTAGDNLGTITYSPMNYCYNVLAGGTADENLTFVVKTLYWYSEAAKNYFGT
ncbi:MAG: hypothetical protein UFA98_08495 [Ruminococcus sp.]|nr:hypothetical protein [Ruminococcus sp.]